RAQVRQDQGARAARDHAQGDVQGRGGVRGGEAGVAGDHRVPEGAAEVPAAGRTNSEGRAAARAAGLGQDPAREGGGGRGGRAVLLVERLGLRGDVRGGGGERDRRY